MTYRVLVTGSRDWEAWELVCNQLSQLADEHPGLVVVHGACPTGADAAANWWCRYYGDRHGATVERHPADWATWGRTAGFRRNAEMVEAGANQCLAFINACTIPGCHRPQPHGSHGATHCANLAQGLGIPTTWWRPWDTPDDDGPDQPDLFTDTEEDNRGDH